MKIGHRNYEEFINELERVMLSEGVLNIEHKELIGRMGIIYFSPNAILLK